MRTALLVLALMALLFAVNAARGNIIVSGHGDPLGETQISIKVPDGTEIVTVGRTTTVDGRTVYDAEVIKGVSDEASPPEKDLPNEFTQDLVHGISVGSFGLVFAILLVIGVHKVFNERSN